MKVKTKKQSAQDFKVYLTTDFTKLLKKLLPIKYDLQLLINKLSKNPETGVLII